ncbi:hypothetical protein X975_11258, partial [Stegodyphus mimosarum]
RTLCIIHIFFFFWVLNFNIKLFPILYCIINSKQDFSYTFVTFDIQWKKSY